MSKLCGCGEALWQESNILHLSFSSPLFHQYLHCGGIQTIVGHVGATHTHPFRGNQWLMRHRSDGSLGPQLLQLRKHLEQGVLQAIAGVEGWWRHCFTFRVQAQGIPGEFLADSVP